MNEQGMLEWHHGTNHPRKLDILGESMDLLAQDDKLALKSMLAQWVVQAFCRCIKDLDSFVAHELLTTKEVEPVVDFIVATEEMADVFVVVDVADLSTEVIREKVVL